MTQFVTLLDSKKNEKKVTIFTHISTTDKGWVDITNESGYALSNYEKIIFLGNCTNDGDMFACYDKDGFIEIYKGEKGDEFEGL